MIMQHVSHASLTWASDVLSGGDFNAHLGNLEDTPVEQLDGSWLHVPLLPWMAMLLKCTTWQARVVDADTCRACYMGVVTARVQPDIPSCTSFTHRNTH
jgi:hypothetical protein